jgi:negative regulator of sigma E activity
VLATAAPSPSPTDVLRAAMQAPARVSYVGEMQTMRIGDQHGEVAIYRVEHRAPDMTRKWYLAPEDLYGDSTISRGSVSFAVDVKRNRVVVSENDALDDQDAIAVNFDLLTRNYRGVFGPDETFDGHPVHVITLINKYTGETTMRVHVDAQNDLVLERERFDSKGSVVEQTRFEHIRFSNDIPPAVFAMPAKMAIVQGDARTKPSSDVNAIARTAGFAARTPPYLPEGFVPVAGYVVEINGVRTIHVLYSDGIRTVSLFEDKGENSVDLQRYHPTAAAVGSGSAQYAEQGSTRLLVWTAAGVHYSLVGDLNQQELEKIADSLGE